MCKRAMVCTFASVLFRPNANRDHSTKLRPCCRGWDRCLTHPIHDRPSRQQTQLRRDTPESLASIVGAFECGRSSDCLPAAYLLKASRQCHLSDIPTAIECLLAETGQSIFSERTRVHEADKFHRPEKKAFHAVCQVHPRPTEPPNSHHQTPHR